MRLFYISFGVIVIFITLFSFKDKWELYEIDKDGVTVKMAITNLPKYCDHKKIGNYAAFTYQQVTYSKKIPVGYCKQHKVGELVEMKYVEGQKAILFPEERLSWYFVALGVFVLLGLSSILFGIFKRG